MPSFNAILRGQQLKSVFRFGAILATLFFTSISLAAEPGDDWRGTRRWIGPQWWANPMTEWSIGDGAAIGPALADRTLCLLTRRLKGDGDRFSMSVDIEFLGDADAERHAAGFRLGRRGGIDDDRHSLLHATEWIDFTLRPDGSLSVGRTSMDGSVSLVDGPVTLQLVGQRKGDQTQVLLSIAGGSRTATLETRVYTKDLAGGISLFTDGPANGPANGNAKATVAFSNFKISGDWTSKHQDSRFGPILWSQYTVHDGQVRLLAQFAPLSTEEDFKADLMIAQPNESQPGSESKWKKVATSKIDKLSRTAVFDLPDWDSSTSVDYQVQFQWEGNAYTWDGKFRQEPKPEEPLKLACFSCDNGYLFPIPAMVQQVTRQDPDMLFFAGDQIYESYGGFGVMRGAETDIAIIDFMRKYYQFGWTWRTLLRDRPSVILQDDHDVFQGNIWGNGGTKLPTPNTTPNAKPDWTLGGYLMPGDWVNAVERMHVGHLPDPAVDITLPIGIKPYFTQLNYGGVGFAILEDRKFKTGPRTLPPEQRTRGGDADLLGKEQETFLKDWSTNWNDHQMKCALSQTIFCRAATHTGPPLKRSKGAADSGGWPTKARDRVVRILGDCNAISIHGDQHLGVLLQQGIEDFGDAGYAFMVPGTANGWPRAWWPGYGNDPPPKGIDFTGQHRDDIGNPLTFLAVGNPEPGSNLIPKTALPMEIGYRKGSGYGIVIFDKESKTAQVSLYRLGDHEEQFAGFPQTLPVGGKP